jgi:hypothetical protein
MNNATTGTRTIKASRPAVSGSPALPAAAMRNVTIASGLMAGPYTDAKPRARGAGYANITLDWWTTQPNSDTTGCIGTCNGWDLDLFVRLPSGSYIYWGSNGDLMTSPYVFYPRDSLEDLEPVETIVIGPSAANGVYKVFVDKFPYSSNFNPSWANSRASLQVFNAATLFQNYQSFPGTCGTLRYWHVGNLTKSGNTYTWTGVNTCSNTSP